MRAEPSGEVFSPPFSNARVCGTRKRSSRFRLRVNRVCVSVDDTRKFSFEIESCRGCVPEF